MMVRKALFSALVSVGCLFVAGCGDSSDGGSQSGLPDGANDIFTEADIELYEEQGFVVHRGSNPPNIEGTYEMADSVITYDESGELSGRGLYTYEWTFADQSGEELSVSYVSPEGGDQASGAGGFIAGDGDCFTVMSKLERVDDGCVFFRTHMFSGCKVDGGIDDFQTAYHGRFTGESADGTTECTAEEAPHRMSVEQDGMIDRISQ